MFRLSLLLVSSLALTLSVSPCQTAAAEAEKAYAQAVEAAKAGELRGAVSSLRQIVDADPTEPRYACTLASVLGQSGDWKAARQAVSECLRLKDDFPGGQELAGEIAALLGDRSQAIVHLTEAVRQQPDNFPALNLLGLQYAQSGDFSSAKTQFDAALALRPKDPSVHFNLGLVLLNEQDAPAAEDEFRRALELSPEHPQARSQLAYSLLEQLKRGRPERAKDAASAFEQAIEHQPQDPDLRFNAAYVLGVLSENEKALENYQEVLRLRPDYPAARYYLGVTYYLLQRREDAIRELQTVLRTNQGFGVRYHLGAALLRAGRHEEALGQLAEAARQQPENSKVHFQLGLAYQRLGRADHARKERERFQELERQQQRKERAEALQRATANALRRGSVDEGLRALEQLFASDPSAVAARNLGLAHIQKGNLDAAASFLTKALELSRDDAATHNYLGLLESERENFELAYEHFHKAATLDGSLAEPLYNAGLALVRLGRLRGAIEHLQQALAREQAPYIHRGLAAALLEAGRADEAQKHLDAAQSP